MKNFYSGPVVYPTVLELWKATAEAPQFNPEGVARGTHLAVRFPENCANCGALVFRTTEGAWTAWPSGSATCPSNEPHQVLLTADGKTVK